MLLRARSQKNCRGAGRPPDVISRAEREGRAFQIECNMSKSGER